MPGDTVTISKESHIIAIRYGKNVSRGIQEMDAVIKVMEQKELNYISRIANLEEVNARLSKQVFGDVV